MKRRKGLLLLIPALLLAGCATTTPTPNPDVENPDGDNENNKPNPDVDTTDYDALLTKALNQYKNGYSLETIVNEEINGKKTRFITETLSANEKISLRIYQKVEGDKVPTKDQLFTFETYYQRENDKACTARVGANNKLYYLEVLHPAGIGTYKYKEHGYYNFFSQLSLDKFVKEGNNKYLLKTNDESLKNLYDSITLQLYGNPGFELDNFVITVSKEGELTINAKFKQYNGNKGDVYNYSFESKLTDEPFVEKSKTFEEVKDETFTNAMNKLKEGNFTLTQKEKVNDKVVKTQTLKMNPDHFYAVYYDEYDKPIEKGYYKDGEKYYNVIKDEKNNYIKGGESRIEDFNLFVPSFDLSRSVFDFNRSYKFKKHVDGEITIFTPFISDAIMLNDFTIVLTDDQYLFRNVDHDTTCEVVFSNIGTTDVGYTKDTVKNADELIVRPWGELLDATSFTKLTNLVGGDIDRLPVPEGYNNKEGWTAEIDGKDLEGSLMYDPSFKSCTAEDLSKYATSLETLGYVKSTNAGPNDGTLLTLEASNATLNVELVNYYEQIFTILITRTPKAAPTWATILPAETLTELTTLVGGDLSILPLPTGFDQPNVWECDLYPNDGEGTLFYDASVKASTAQDLETYASALVSKGFTRQVEPGEIGGGIALALELKEEILTVEILNQYDTVFTICIIRTPKPAPTWNKVITESNLTKLTDLVGGDLSILPLPTGFDQPNVWECDLYPNDGEGTLFYDASVKASTAQDLETYASALVSKGFTRQVEPGEIGGGIALTLELKEEILTVEILNQYDTVFTICIIKTPKITA